MKILLEWGSRSVSIPRVPNTLFLLSYNIYRALSHRSPDHQAITLEGRNYEKHNQRWPSSAIKWLCIRTHESILDIYDQEDLVLVTARFSLSFRCWTYFEWHDNKRSIPVFFFSIRIPELNITVIIYPRYVERLSRIYCSETYPSHVLYEMQDDISVMTFL